MDCSLLLPKMEQLERDLLELKSKFPKKTAFARTIARIKKPIDGIISYWVPLALILGLVVNWWFGVAFFESIKNIGINKQSSDYYCHIGDVLMSHAEFKAASDAYAKSLAINPNNINGTHGLMKAQVFQAIGDNERVNPIVVEDKLTYLRDIFGKNDYILLYWEGILRRQQSGSGNDLKLPESLFQQSIDQNNNFLGSHLELGKTFLLAGELDKASQKFKYVADIDPRFPDVLDNLGYCQLVSATLEKEHEARKQALETAIGSLEKALKADRHPETDLHLGDAYLYRGQYQSARISHENALGALERLDPGNKNYTSPELLFVFLPESTHEARDRGPAITISSLGELKMLVLYSLSLDHASLSEFQDADQYFAQARTLDPRNLLSPLVANRFYSIHGSGRLKTKLDTWLNTKIETLCKGKDGCKPEALNRRKTQ